MDELIFPVGLNATAAVVFRGPHRPTREYVEMLIRFLEISLDTFPPEHPPLPASPANTAAGETS